MDYCADCTYYVFCTQKCNNTGGKYCGEERYSFAEACDEYVEWIDECAYDEWEDD